MHAHGYVCSNAAESVHDLHNSVGSCAGHKKKLLLAAKQMNCQDPSAAKRKMKRRKSASAPNRVTPVKPVGDAHVASKQ